ncbi:MAG TPA: trigger factor [Firmicutes bacterium]|jgi:trigger factor|nr:trigger factor [Bacillota bacterium]
MATKLEKLENSRVKLTVDIDADVLEQAMQEAYRRNVKRINIPGFRKGKAPRKIIELNYGPDVFLQDAVEILLPRLYEEAVEETQIRPVDQPDADLTEVERGKGATFTFTVDVYPELTLGNYKDLEVEREIVTITDADVENVLKQQQERSAQLVVSERTTVQEGDFCVIDFIGYVDGKPFSGGAGENQVLEIGSGRFIPGFEEQLIGFEVGQTSDINVTFPETYHAEELAGKDAVFSVTVKELKEKVVPELDDEFAKDISEFDTMEELRATIRKNLEDEATRRTNAAMENKLLERIAEDSEVEVPQSMVRHEAEHLYEMFIYNLAGQGIGEEMYLEMTGQSKEQLLENFLPQAETRIIHDLILEAIREKEGIEVSDEEIDDKITEYMEEYGDGDLDPAAQERMREHYEKNRTGIANSLAREKTMKVIVDSARITEVEAAQDSEQSEVEEAEESAE